MIASVVATGATVPVHVTGFNPTSYGVWGILLVQLVVLTGYLIRRGPDYIASWMASKKQEAELKQADEDAEAKREASNRELIQGLQDQINRMNTALGFVMNAAITSANALERMSKDDPAIKQSRDLLAMAASTLGNEDPFSKSLAQLSRFKGVDE